VLLALEIKYTIIFFIFLFFYKKIIEKKGVLIHCLLNKEICFSCVLLYSLVLLDINGQQSSETPDHY
jgi:hypothetical protein